MSSIPNTASASAVEEKLEETDFVPEFDREENITNIDFTGDALDPGTHFVFNVIAPYVKEGSYIEMGDADGVRCRYVFKDRKCIKMKPMITWVEA